ncbi:hypothetical protein M422DRAFT_208618 [Sphaerobolus stellatus SS14]|uniref:AB hydrolase-1 domain-containing protein n=1 Tax=Sphaerobolus stellatus (strain SS14) TaxID=990650 RepID=A0A0C9VYG2_SPHS4|nr:hypothetical protein M422DRAFT_208618 [Sphaerobolus stellatus SS14]
MAFADLKQDLTSVTSGAKINTYYRPAPTPGKPTILLLHGYPQNALMWKDFVHEIPEEYPVLVADLPGYGLSTKSPSPSGDSLSHSKREWAKDIVEAIDVLPGSPTQLIVFGHDRGGRLAYRLALDFPERVKAIGVLDMVPTPFMWGAMNLDNNLHKETRASWHWVFLSAPRPFPETFISTQASFFFTNIMRGATGPAARDRPNWSNWAYDSINQYTDPELGYDRVVGSCEDYRAGATHDLVFDLEDGLNPKEPKRVFKVPILALSSVFLRARLPVDEIWKSVGKEGLVESYQIGDEKTGHFFVNEEPEEVGRRLREWLVKI